MRKPNPPPPSPVPSLLKGILPILAGCVMFGTGCVWHTETDLYPSTAPCDTTHITFENGVQDIINNRCLHCHSGSSPSAGIDFSDTEVVVDLALSGSIMDRVNRPPGDPLLMPPSEPLPECKLLTLDVWIQAGCPLN